MARTGLPATIDEQRMIAWASDLVARIKAKLTSPAPNEFEWFVAHLTEFIQRGDFTTMTETIAAADAGDEIAHAALDRVFRAQLDAHKLPVAQLIDYHRRASAPGRRRGHFWFEDRRRNAGLMILIRLTCEAFGVPPTRNREARRARRPCGSSVVAAALACNGLEIGEGRLTNLWGRQGRITMLMMDRWRADFLANRVHE